MELLTSADVWIAFATLLVLEIVLGVDNVVFISILAGRLPACQQSRTRIVGLTLALITRILLLLSLSWVIGLTAPLFSVGGHQVSGRDLILLAGGAFLVVKSTHEMHRRVEGAESHEEGRGASSFASVLVQIVVLDVVFSLDSVITAVGMVDQLAVMIAAVLVAIALMMALARTISEFVNRHPTVKMLALAFLLLIGGSLIADGLHYHIPKGYIYGPIAFSVFVEAMNLWAGARTARRRARAAGVDTSAEAFLEAEIASAAGAGAPGPQGGQWAAVTY
jgi:predicted tellurium resistance membrane protein TerC